MLKSFNILTGSCSSKFCSSDVLIDEQHQKMAANLPVLYVVVAFAIISFIAFFPQQEILTFAKIFILILFSFSRGYFWMKQRRHPNGRTHVEKRRDLTGVVLISPVISFIVSINTSGLLGLSLSNEHNLLALAIFMLVIAGSFALVSLPMASGLVVVGGALPIIVPALMSPEQAPAWIILAIFLTAGMTIFLLINGFRSFAREVLNRTRLADKTDKAIKDKAVISRLAYEDSLTDLPNRRKFLSMLVDQAQITLKSGENFAVGLLDIDHFKTINDLHGHSGGDSILRQVSCRLQKAVEGKGLVARMGGDEFAVMFFNVYNVGEAHDAAEAIHKVMEESFLVGDSKLLLSTSIGMTVFPSSDTSIEAVLTQADQALYQAKRTGRAKTEVFSISLEEKNQRRSQVTQALKLAVRNDKIDLVFQPIIDMNDGAYDSCEALARWADKKLGPISPAYFIEIAEQNGMIEELTFNLLRKAAKAAMSWPSQMRLNFNLSAILLLDCSISENILKTIAACGLAPERLEIEITETAFVNNVEIARRALEKLSNAGVKIALDDFGTGYSNLGQLGDLPIDRIKIDKSFVDLIATDRKKSSLVKSIISICDNLELECVAEGIETSEQLGILSDMGCQFGQGYFFSKPVRASKIARIASIEAMDAMAA